jgi:hypothetical protein
MDCSKVVSNAADLLQYGICQLPVPNETVSEERWLQWARELSQSTPEIVFGQGDGEHAFYRNIMDEPNFPFKDILESTQLLHVLKDRFGVGMDDLRLDDAFCVHYNDGQDDTTGAMHTDPSDITINMCLEKIKDTIGSHVVFYGAKELVGVESNLNNFQLDEKCVVEQLQGYMTIHWGNHPHETTALEAGRRTNIIITLVLEDSAKSDVGARTCYM